MKIHCKKREIDVLIFQSLHNLNSLRRNTDPIYDPADAWFKGDEGHF